MQRSRPFLLAASIRGLGGKAAVEFFVKPGGNLKKFGLHPKKVAIPSCSLETSL